MFVLQHLPVELALQSLSYLTVQHLSALLKASSYWMSFFYANEPTIYRNAAALHAFVPSPDISLSYANSLYPDRSMMGVDSWKTFCKRRFQIAKGWIGRAPSVIRTYEETGSVHRFKVDEYAGIIIATSDEGGLTVTDIWNNQVVWALPPHYVHRYAHCEYENGFICFDRIDGSIEVWRRASDFEASAMPTLSGPDQRQLNVSAQADIRYRSSASHHQFKPWALFSMPNSLAFRFIFPTLLVASEDKAFLWDVTAAQLSLTIENTHPEAQMAYVELSDHLVFICFTGLLRVFSRHDGRRVYDLNLSSLRNGDFAHQACLTRKQCINHASVLVEQAIELHRLDFTTQYINISFLAVHTSGSDVAILFTDSIIAVIRNFEMVINGQAGLSDSSFLIALSLPVPATYLAFANGKVAVTSNSGIYVIALDGLENMNSSLSEVGERLHPNFPNITGSSSLHFESRSILQRPTCLQVTDTALWYTWDHRGRGHGFDIELDGVVVHRAAHRVATVLDVSLPEAE